MSARGVMEVEATPHVGGTVELVAKNKKFRDVIPLARFREMKLVPIIKPAEVWSIYTGLAFTIIGMLSLSLPSVVEILRARKLRGILPDGDRRN